MAEALQREAVYLLYYTRILIWQITPFWALGILVGSIVSVFGKERLQSIFASLQYRRLGVFGIIPASLLG